ncbi:MAG TPA: LysR substrate-binding domain-containing protein [Allosphingosinicella sp.]|nr:LysR substrate-binding domain-containing protein [Allosphingosinicella sp.]
MREIDLNLLRVFDALIELRSVTRAADRLGLTQSAISHALGRLRLAVDDPLFVRRPGGLQPTARALEIAPGIRQGLTQLRGALSPSPFDPATAVRRFRISAGSYFCALLVPDLAARARGRAPGISFSIVAPGPDLPSQLDEGTIDLALGAFGKAPPRLVSEFLFREELVWAARAGSPIVAKPSLLQDLPPERRLDIAAGRPFRGHGSYSWEGGLERRVVAVAAAADGAGGEEGQMTLYDVPTAIATVAATDLVALVPRRLVPKSAAPERIAIVESSAESGLDMAMLWHSRLAGDAGLLWLRTLVRDCLGAGEDGQAPVPEK